MEGRFNQGDVVYLKSDIDRRVPMTVLAVNDFAKTPDSYFRNNMRFTADLTTEAWTEETIESYRRQTPDIHCRWHDAQMSLKSGTFQVYELTKHEV